MFGLIALHERRRTDFLSDAFASAYEESAPKYLELLRVIHEGGTIGTLEVGPPEVDEKDRPVSSSKPLRPT